MTIDSTLLKELYKLSVEEDRYQVQLNWDKAKFLLLLNASLIAAAAALLRSGEGTVAALLVVLTFSAAMIVATVGIIGLREGKEYHRRSVAKSVVIGDLLGLTRGSLPSGIVDEEFTLQLVSGMKRSKAERILAGPEAHVTRKLRTWSVSHGVGLAFVCFLVLDILGAGIAVYVALGCPWTGCA